MRNVPLALAHPQRDEAIRLRDTLPAAGERAPLTGIESEFTGLAAALPASSCVYLRDVCILRGCDDGNCLGNCDPQRVPQYLWVAGERMPDAETAARVAYALSQAR